MSLGAGCRSPSLSGELIPHNHHLHLQLWSLFAFSWRRGGQSPAVGWEEVFLWGAKGTGVQLLSSAAFQGHPWPCGGRAPGME